MCDLLPSSLILLLCIANAPSGEHAGEGGAIRFLLLNLFRAKPCQEGLDEGVAWRQFSGSRNIPTKQIKVGLVCHIVEGFFAAESKRKKFRMQDQRQQLKTYQLSMWDSHQWEIEHGRRIPE